MKTYKVIVNNEAVSDLDGISTYVAGLYRPESGHNYVNRILGNWLRFPTLLICIGIANLRRQEESIRRPKHFPS